MERIYEKYQGAVAEVTIGAGSRSPIVKVGGEDGLFFIRNEGRTPNPPAIALEISDTDKAPVEKAAGLASEHKPALVCLRLLSIHPDGENRDADYAAHLVKDLLGAVAQPLIILGCGQAEKDNEVMVKVAEASQGEGCLLGIAAQNNYKTLAMAAMSGGHLIIAESPIDINIAKQLNILIADLGFPLNKIIMHPATGALGYGLEYTYSIMERSRLAALQGDKMLTPPIINFIGQEAWRTKEAETMGEIWEYITAVAYLNSGCDILVLRHSDVARRIRGVIGALCDAT